MITKFQNIIPSFKTRWTIEGGYAEVLHIAFPLILSTSALSLQHFIDRLFLTWHSPEAVAAAMPAGILNLALISIFVGTASYVGTFVAQYTGAGNDRMIGISVWQGIYISLFGGLFYLIFIPLAGPIFSAVHHAPLVQNYETIYFKVLTLGAFPSIASAALTGFYAGQGKTWPVLWINLVATIVNIVGDYLLIFGKFGFPAMGIQGAGIATDLSLLTSMILFIVLIFRSERNRRQYALKNWKFDRKLFGRLIRFGLPSGVQFFIDMAGFTVFLFIMGRLGTTQLAATNVAFNINNLAFMPMMGLGATVSILVGQYLGKDQPTLAERSVYSCFHLTFIYMFSISVAYFFFPEFFMIPFDSKVNPEQFRPVREIAVVLLKFVAVYSIFDTLNIIFASAIKGAGDTRFVMIMLVFLSFGLMVIPTYIVVVILKMNVYAAWACASLYVITLGLIFYARFLNGKWKSMRVIETVIPIITPSMPDLPTPD
ncbi:MAG: MATE family efflux transporter [Candidatus Neomarinimicrobiota bacterium]